MSGVELALAVFHRTTDQIPDVDTSAYREKSPEYWASWSLTYYQWTSGMPFREIVFRGLTVSTVCSMYLLHEADIRKFAEAAGKVNREKLRDCEVNLKRIRRASWRI